MLRIARRFAQAVSVRETTSPKFAWVLSDDGEDELETVDVTNGRNPCNSGFALVKQFH